MAPRAGASGWVKTHRARLIGGECAVGDNCVMGRAIDDGLDVMEDEEYGYEGERRKRRGPGFVLLMLCILVLVVVLGFVGFYVARSLTALNSIDRDEKLTPTEYAGRPASSEPKPAAPGQEEVAAPINFVLMGSDTAEGDSGRSDSLMVAHVTGDRQAVYLVSFPRDLWVDIPGRGKGKLNWAYAFGGPQLTVRTLEQLTGVRMDHTVNIDFEGFMALTDAVGGVTVYNPWPTNQNPEHKFEQGEVQLQGERALAYVRERYELPNGDFDRAFRQRTVVKAIIRKLMTPETLANPATFSNVVGQVADTMTVDTGMTNGYVTELALSMRITSGESIGLLQAPVKGVSMVGDQSVVVADLPGIQNLSASLGGDTMDEYFAEHRGDAQDKLGQVEPPE